MGDSTCVLHAYSHDQSTQGNMMHSLTDSVSLGRFMSEQLAWEKWSTFSSNRYVEEAERYAQPGSVAQKKAFFEAHYKKIAAQKAAAAAAAEQAKNNGVSDGTNHDAEPEAVTVTAPPPPPLTSMYIHPTTHDHRAPPPPQEKEKVAEEFMEPEPEGLVVKEDEPSDVIAPPESEKPLLLQQNSSSEQQISSVKMKKKSAFSSLKSSVYRKTSSKIPGSSPARLPQIKKQGGANHVAATATPVIKSKKKQALDFTDKKNLAPKSPLQLLVNSSPVKQLTQLLSPSRKTDTVSSSRIAPDSSKMSQNCKTPVATQNMMSRYSAVVATTPCPADTRTKTPADENKTAGPKRHILSTLCSKSLTACRNKLQSPTLSTPFLLRTEERAARRKQKLEEKFNSKKDVEKVKVQPPQTSFKEKAESELRKLQQSFCFKARPLPDFYKEREAQNNQIKKIPVSQPHSPKLGRKANSSRTAKNAVALPKSAQKKKNGILKHVSASSSLQEMIDHENSSPNIQH